MKSIAIAVALAACGHPHGFGAGPDASGGGSDDGGGSGDHMDAGSGSGARDATVDAPVDAPADAAMPGACSGLTICGGLSSGTNAAALSVAVDSHDNVYVAGLAESDLVFAGHTLYQIGTRDAFIVSYTSTGAYRWAKRFGDGQIESLVGAYGIAVDSNDNIFITGGLFGGADFGAGVIGGAGAFVASFDAAGNYRWARADGGGTGSLAIAVAGTHVYSIGRFSNTMTFSPSVSVTSAGDVDVDIAAYDTATGTPLWARREGGPYTDVEGGIVATPEWIAFTMSTALVGSGEQMISMTADGVDRWTTPLAASIDLRGLAVDAAGALYNTGLHQGGIDTIGGAPTSSGDSSFIRAFTTTGASSWAWTLPMLPAYTWSAIPLTPSTIDRNGHLIIAGTFDGSIYAGGAALTGGNETVFTASFDASGSPIASRAIDDHATQSFEWTHALAVDATGQRWIVGQYFGTPNFGDGALPFASEGGAMILSVR